MGVTQESVCVEEGFTYRRTNRSDPGPTARFIPVWGPARVRQGISVRQVVLASSALSISHRH
jgi:hypothetical protein